MYFSSSVGLFEVEADVLHDLGNEAVYLLDGGLGGVLGQLGQLGFFLLLLRCKEAA